MDKADQHKTTQEKLTGVFSKLMVTAVKRVKGGTTPGTSITSAVGYSRYGGGAYPDEMGKPDEQTLTGRHDDEWNEEQTLTGRHDDEWNEEHADDSTGTGSEEESDMSPSDQASLNRDEDLSSLPPGEQRPKKDSVVELDFDGTPTHKMDSITEWQAGWNVTSAIQGMFIVSFPYTVHQGGYWALMAMIVVAGICCYTGKILVECLYEVHNSLKPSRVRTSYADIAEEVFGKRLGRPLVNTAQIIELLMTCILYVLLCGELLQGSFPHTKIPLGVWIMLSSIPLLFCAFLKTMRRVSWLSLWCTVAHMLINLIIIIYCLTLVKQWQPRAVQIKPDVWTVPISLGVIVFSYTSQIFLPTLEGKMVHREKFSCMMHWTHLAAAIFKVVFSYIGYITWGEDTKEVITNNLPLGLKVVVNIILVLKALLSYPLPYFAAVEILENSFFNENKDTFWPSCYKDDSTFKWWAIILRLLLVLLTMLMAIFIPHFAILMGLIGSLTGCMLSFIWPCVFHIYLKRNTMKWWEVLADVVTILLGVLCGLMGVYYSTYALIQSYKGPKSLSSDITEHVANETLKSHLLG